MAKTPAPPSKPSALVTRTLERLRGDDAPLRSQGVALALNAALDQPLSAWVDTDDLATWVTAAMSGENTARWVSRHGWPAFERAQERASVHPHTPGEWVGDDAAGRLQTIVTGFSPPPTPDWAKRAVDRALVRKLLAPVWQELLQNFARKLPLVGGPNNGQAAEPEPAKGRGFSSGLGLRKALKSRVESSAEQIGAHAKSVFGGLGAEMERQVQGVVREFSENASETVRDAIDRRIHSDEGKVLVRQLQAHALSTVLGTPMAELQSQSDEFPVRALMDVLPLITEHQRRAGHLERDLREEVDALLALDGERSLRELLSEAGLLDVTLGQMMARLDALAAETVEQPGFESWLGELLAE
ncbi:MAG: hypothetical protein ACI81R_001622 [Bradymonadia bacterium]